MSEILGANLGDRFKDIKTKDVYDKEGTISKLDREKHLEDRIVEIGDKIKNINYLQEEYDGKEIAEKLSMLKQKDFTIDLDEMRPALGQFLRGEIDAVKLANFFGKNEDEEVAYDIERDEGTGKEISRTRVGYNGLEALKVALEKMGIETNGKLEEWEETEEWREAA